MATPLPRVPSGGITLPKRATGGVDLPETPNSPVTLVDPVDPVDLPEVPHAQLRPEDLPASRWHTFFLSLGQLEGRVAIPWDADYESEGSLTLNARATVPADFTAGGQLGFGGGASPEVDFTSEGTLTAESQAWGDAVFTANASLHAKPVSIAGAFYGATGQIGIGAYEVEILAVMFEGDGQADLSAATLHVESQGGAGSLSATTQAKLVEPLSAEGDLLVPSQIPWDGDFAGEGEVAFEIQRSAAETHTGTGQLVLPPVPKWQAPYAGQGSVTLAAQRAYVDNWGPEFANQVTISQNSWVTRLSFTVTGIGTAIPVNFSVTHQWDSSALQLVTVYRRLRITINGVQVGNYAQQGHTTGGWSTTSTWNNITVAPGQTIAIQAWSECVYSGPRRNTISAASMTMIP